MRFVGPGCGAWRVSPSTTRRWRRSPSCARRCAANWASRLCAHSTNREIDALHARVVALLDNPLVPTPDRRRPSRGRPSSTYVSLSVARISNNSLSWASASAASTGPACTPTRQIEMSDSPACVAADTRASIPSASMRFTPDRSSANSAGDQFSSLATTWRIVAVAPRSSSPLTCMTLLFVGDRFTSTVTEQGCVWLPSAGSFTSPSRCASLRRQRNPSMAVGLATEAQGAWR